MIAGAKIANGLPSKIGLISSVIIRPQFADGGEMPEPEEVDTCNQDYRGCESESQVGQQHVRDVRQDLHHEDRGHLLAPRNGCFDVGLRRDIESG